MFKEPGSVSVFQIQTWIQKAIEYRSNPDSKHWVLRGRPSLATCGVERSTHSTNLRCKEVDPFYQPAVWRGRPILPTWGVKKSTHSTNLRCGKVDPFYQPAVWKGRPILPTCVVDKSTHSTNLRCISKLTRGGRRRAWRRWRQTSTNSGCSSPTSVWKQQKNIW